jgi:hypothetical protein
MPWWNYFSNPLFWILLAGGFLLMLLLGTLFLAIGLFAAEAKHVTLKDVVTTNLIGTALDYIPILGIFLYWRTLNMRHEIGLPMAAAIWVIAWFIPVLMISIPIFLFLLPGFIPFWAL